jgi:hypothetical protein
MRLIIAEKSFMDRVAGATNASEEEMMVRGDLLVREYVKHVKAFGVAVLPQHSINGKVATLTVSLTPSHSEEDVQQRMEGLGWLVPVAVSLDAPDVPAFCPNRPMATAIADNWQSFGASLQRLTLAEVRPALETVAGQIINTPVAPPSNEFEAEVRQLEYEQFLLEAGKGDQIRKEQKRREIEEFEQAEIAHVKAAQEKALMEEWGR